MDISSFHAGSSGMIIKKNYALYENLNDIQLKILDHGHAVTDGKWIGNVVSPMYSRIYYIIGGDPYVVINDHRIDLEIGKCYLFPTGFSFRHACQSSMEQLYFHINLNDHTGTDLLRSCQHMMEYIPRPELIQDMLDKTFSNKVSDNLKLRQALYGSILAMTDKYNISLSTAHYSRCVLLAMEYIKKHLSLKLTVGELAVNSFVSESTLSKRFRSEVGITLGSYIDENIFFEAEQLLLKTDLTVLQISERFGFCDQFYFSRRFKQKYGETPQKYRKLRLI